MRIRTADPDGGGSALYRVPFDCIYILYFLFVNNFNFILLCPQLAVKTKYMDTLIKLLLTYLRQ